MARKNPVVKAQTRDRFGKGEMHRMRDEGLVPGVVYGPDEETVSLMVDAKEMFHLLNHVSIENTIVDLDLSGEVKKKYKTLIREVQRHPFKEVLRHIDFYCVPKGRKISVQVPIVLHGTAIGVTEQGGIVQHALRELEIMVLPTDIPEQIVVDISELHINESIHVSDLKDEGFEILSDELSSIVSVVPPVVIAEPEEDEDELAEGELAEGDEDAEADDQESEE
jgi:large subunit ribosomal protein L25